MRWRLLVTDAACGAWNMAVDEAVAWAVSCGQSPPTIRFFQWDPPCLSLGYNQPYEVVDEGFCRANGIAITRRPTGGRAVLHHRELTYSVVAKWGWPPFGNGLQENYRLICEGLICGLRRLGVAAELSSAPPQLERPTGAAPCFMQPAGGEVVVKGRKLVGSAMRRWGAVLLQHGSLLLDWDSRWQAGVLGLASDTGLRAGVVTLKELLGQEPSWETLVEALGHGLGLKLEADLLPGALTQQERNHAQWLAQEVYSSPAFVVHRQRPAFGFGQEEVGASG
ncbi:MAG: lipoate--protein ligase family protein [Thermoanaerobaculaceae bacterium]